MKDTPCADGVPGLSQEPIAPGETFVYEFKAYPAGTFWYHSHHKGLVQDGQVGSLYIRYACLKEPATKVQLKNENGMLTNCQPQAICSTSLLSHH
jgi:hypothetical protein